METRCSARLGSSQARVVRLERSSNGCDIHWTNDRDKFQTDISALDNEFGRADQCPRLLFHVGRCGSTLFSNLLSTVDNLETLNEPPVFEQFIRHYYALSTDELDVKGRRVASLLRRTVKQQPTQCQMVIKLPSFALLLVRDIRPYLDLSKCALLYRDPQSVFSSYARTPPRFLLDENDDFLSRLSRDLAKGPGQSLRIVAYLNELYGIAATLIGSFGVVSSYERLCRAPVGCVETFATRLFGTAELKESSIVALSALDSRTLEPHSSSCYPRVNSHVTEALLPARRAFQLLSEWENDDGRAKADKSRRS